MTDNTRFPLSFRLLKLGVFISGGITLIGGLLVLLGWYTHSTALLQVSKAFSPMQYVTAVGFVLCGAGLLLVSTGHRIAAIISGGIAGLLSLLTLIQYIFDLQLGLEYLFMTPYLIDGIEFPNLMSPNTAICFTLTAAGLILLGKKRPISYRPLLVGIFGSMIVAVGAVAFFGYLSGIETAYGWEDLPRMAIHTSVGLIILGTGVFLIGWREDVTGTHRVPRWLSIPAGIGLAAIALFQWQALKAQEVRAYEMMYPAKESALPTVILGAGLLMAGMLAVTIQLAQKLWGRARAVEKANRHLQAEISERKRVEEALRMGEADYRLLADNTLDCIWRMSLDFKFTYINSSVKTMLGYSAFEWIGSSLQHHCSKEDFVAFDNCVARELSNARRHKGMTFETQLLHKKGRKVPVEINGKLLLDERGIPVEMQGTIRDITPRKKTEAEKERLEDLLRHAQKMEAIGTLAGGIAHDFNNILGVIMGYSELSLDDIPESHPVRHNLNQILISADRAKEMVQQILAFSRKSKVERTPVQLTAIVREALKLLRSTIPTTIEIRSTIDNELEPVLADATQLHQVIMNLSTNAAHAMRGNGGLLEINLTKVEIGPDTIDLKELTPGKYQLLTVRDTGHGMDEETQKRVFEPYFTTKKVGEGTGMGLAVVHGIVHDHGGFITVRSEPGYGTSFDIFLPAVPVEMMRQPEKLVSVLPIGGRERILLVDDEPALAEMGKMLLEKLGYQVDSRTGSVDALSAFRAAKKSFDLVITDQTMPNMTGVQLAKEIKKTHPEIPVILCTGFSESVNEENFKTMGIDGFVMKPIIKKRIAPIIRTLLDKVAESSPGLGN